MNQRACHVLSCQDNESLDVITTIGQAFELRYNEYIQLQKANEQKEYLRFNFKVLFFSLHFFFVFRLLKSSDYDKQFQQVRFYFLA
jgi:hypothetical protein